MNTNPITRILRVTEPDRKSRFYVPQQLINETWQEFFGFDSSSPYLHPKHFLTISEALSFLEKPAIWNPSDSQNGMRVEILSDKETAEHKMERRAA